ncbi:IS1634 family transposase [Catenulispora pinisilvae]|uniref:IS1634 family transposase n=1 Tax=Catenulispora pinisilvae TaxID=2705253 RepID=UPI001891A362|nr:IS1634 family transposase [Catenulispora pinisilvae]
MRQHAQFGTPSVEKLLGALPVVADYCSRLKIRSIVDGLCPVDDQADLTYGQVIEALVANRLTSPAPLVHVQSWADGWAVGEAFGVEPALLNDDRIGRALDAIAPVLDRIAGSVGAAAIEAFGIDVTRIHWDLTSMSMHGDYDKQAEGFPAVKLGHPKDRRTDLKQIQTGLGVTGDGAIPVFHQVFDGGAGEVSQVIPMMRALQEIATERRLLIIGDSKLISYANVAAMDGDGVTFVAPASKAYVSATDLAGLSLHAATEVAYIAGRDAGKPADRRGVWHVVEDAMSVTGPRKADPAVSLRRVFVHSSARASAAITARAKKLQRAAGDLGRLERTLGSRHYPTVEKVDARLAAIRRERRVADYLRTTTGTDPDTGKPILTWSFDPDAIAGEAAGDGWYALLTNLDADETDAAAVLILYKGQEAVERRYSAFKGPLAVTALFLKNNRRIAALITVICLALLIFSLIERQVRIALAEQGQTKVEGLYAGRPAIPTGKLILDALATIKIIPGAGQDPPIIPAPTPLQLRLLDLLGIDPRRLR